MNEYLLHGFAESGNSYKVALMLQLCKADWQPVFVDFMNGATRKDDFRGVNVMGEVPVLEHHKDDGVITLTQSGAILTYLSKRFDCFGGKTELEELEILRWILFDNHKLTGNTAAARFMRVFLNKTDEPETIFLLARAQGALKILNAHLNGRQWVALDRPSIADFSMCGYLFWPEHLGLSWDEYPHIKQWLANIQNLQDWASPEQLLPSAIANSNS